jgi:predicted Zn finger-like uncharacterized protein
MDTFARHSPGVNSDMDLYTRCLNCDTTFRVTTQHLQASGGQVRCGHCKTIFDAFATLTALKPNSLLLSQQRVASVGSAPEPRVSAIQSGTLPGAGTSRPSSASELLPARPDPAASLYEWDFRMPEPRRASRTWLVLALLLAIGLASNILYAFRNEIRVALPQTTGYYSRLCGLLGCRIEAPKLPQYLHIEFSDLKSVDAMRPNEMLLLLSIRNRAPIELAYPAFELTLTNPLEQAVARRIFFSQDYLPSTMKTSGLTGGREMPITLYLDTADLHASGYRLYLFYPER